jgi:L-ribulose-5-phosphate 3-epimerase
MSGWLKSITLRAFPADLHVEQSLDLARSAGFDAVEINLEPNSIYTLESGNAEIRQLAEAVAARNLKVSAVYSRQQWQFPLTSSDPRIAARCRQIIRRLAECATLLGSDAVLVVLGGVDNGLFATRREIVPYDAAYERARDAMGDLAAGLVGSSFAGSLCIENVWNKFLLSPLEMRRFVDEVGTRSVGVYFDVGNVLIHGFPDQWIRILGPRIKRIHFKDFRTAVGTVHGFTGLLQGDVDWPAVISALTEIGYASYLTAEVLPAYRHHGDRLIFECAAAMDAIIGTVSPAV